MGSAMCLIWRLHEQQTKWDANGSQRCSSTWNPTQQIRFRFYTTLIEFAEMLTCVRVVLLQVPLLLAMHEEEAALAKAIARYVDLLALNLLL